jgi:hypothetical protein
VNGADDTELSSPPAPAPRCPGFSPRADNIVPVGIASALDSNGAAAGFFGGQMDEVRIWSYARTQAEIQAARFQQIGTATGLLGAFALNEGAGSTTADTSGTNNQGTLTGSPTWVTGAANIVDLGPRSCTHTPINCSDGDPCTLDLCSGGTCSHPAGNDGAACSDANPCTANDACQGGVCTGGGVAPDGTACNDGQACTSNDRCLGGACTGTSTACDDGNACTQLDGCSGGVCVGSNPVVCAAPGPCHDAGVCDPAESCTGASASCPADAKTPRLCGRRKTASCCSGVSSFAFGMIFLDAVN